jgi:membrane-associated phospholipid phosphatase
MKPLETDQEVRIAASSVWLWSWIALCLAVIAVIQIFGINRSLFLAFNQSMYFLGEKFWALTTFFSDGLFSFVILIPFIRRKPQLIWSVLIAALLFTIFGQGLKHLLQVPRPPQILEEGSFHLIGPDWGHNSFPSGHAAMVFQLAGVWAFTTPRRWLRIALIAAALFIASARIAVGVHWPQDILAGAAFGWLTVWLGLKLARKSRWGWGRTGRIVLGALLLICCVAMFASDYTGHDNIFFEQRVIAVVFFLLGIREYLAVFGIIIPRRSKTSPASRA